MYLWSRTWSPPFATDGQITEEGAHGYNRSESSVCWATMQWRGEKKKLISIQIWAHFGTVRCRPKWKFLFCTFQISAFPEVYVSSLTLCFCSLDMAKSSEREIVETGLFHDTCSLEEGFGISVKGLLWWYAGCSPAEACTDGRKQTTPCRSFASSLQDYYTPRQGTQRERTEPSSRAPPTLRISRSRGVPSGQSLVLSVKTVSVHPKYTRESAHTPFTNEPSAPILSNPPLVHCTQDEAIQETELHLP